MSTLLGGFCAVVSTGTRSLAVRKARRQVRIPTELLQVQQVKLLVQSKGKGKGSPYSITECRVPELIPVLGSQPAGYVSHKPGGRLPLLSARPAVTPATFKRVATNFTAW